ncbi:hypothetical protein VWC42_09135, partial [Klebsiella pneumoniae]|nr:hypothetical protein [Klebsiella pneumoniae]
IVPAFLPGGGFRLTRPTKLQYQTVMQLAVGPRKRSAAGQALKIALCLQSDCLPLLGRHSGG